MALYDRQCKECESIFEVNCKISEKGLDHPCPSCSSTSGEWLMSAPALSSRSERFLNRKDTGFKEVLQKIAERNPRTSVTQQV